MEVKFNSNITNEPIQIGSIRHWNEIFENTRKITNTGREILLKTGGFAILAELSCVVASASSPIPYSTFALIGAAALISFATAGIFTAIDFASNYFKDQLYQANAFPNLEDPAKLLMSECTNLPDEISELIKNYQSNCHPYLKEALSKLNDISTHWRNRQAVQKVKVPHQYVKYDLEKLKQEFEPLQKELFRTIKPFFDEFHRQLIDYAYPKYLDAAEKSPTKKLDRLEYACELHLAIQDLYDVDMIIAFEEVIADPISVRNDALWLITNTTQENNRKNTPSNFSTMIISLLHTKS